MAIESPHSNETVAHARAIIGAQNVKERLEATTEDVGRYLETQHLREGDWPLFQEFEAASSLLASVLAYLASDEQMSLEDAQQILDDDFTARWTTVIVESQKIPSRVVNAPTSKGHYTNGYFLQTKSRLKSRAGEWINSRGPYIHEETARRKLIEWENEASEPSNARVFPCEM